MNNTIHNFENEGALASVPYSSGQSYPPQNQQQQQQQIVSRRSTGSAGSTSSTVSSGSVVVPSMRSSPGSATVSGSRMVVDINDMEAREVQLLEELNRKAEIAIQTLQKNFDEMQLRKCASDMNLCSRFCNDQQPESLDLLATKIARAIVSEMKPSQQ